MSSYVVKKFIDYLKFKKINLKKAKILILGLTFKENCPDLNSKIISIFNKLKNNISQIDLYDPLANENEIKHLFSLEKKFQNFTK